MTYGQHLKRSRHGNLAFRYKFPRDVAHAFGRCEFTIGLATSSKREAAYPAARLKTVMLAAVAVARGMDTNDEAKQRALRSILDRQMIKALKEEVSESEADRKELLAGQAKRDRVIMLLQAKLAKELSDNRMVTPTPAPADPPVVDPVVEIRKARAFQGLDVEGGQMTVSELFVRYCDDHKKAWKHWEYRVKSDYEPAKAALIAVLGGDTRIELLTVAHARRYADHIKAEAARLNHSPKTVADKLSFMKAVLNWARRETLLADLTGPLKKDEDSDGSESYEAFTSEDLKAMFECDEYRQNSFKRASSFWLPLLGLYTGARIAELAEIRLTHIGEDNGVFGVKLSAEGKKAGKNKFSKRFVPIHPALLSCGFDLYVSALRDEGHEQLFPCLPEVNPPKNKGDTGSNDFTKFRRRLGIGGAKNETSKKVFHSFRSTLTTKMQDAGVPQYLREEFDGHAPTGVNATVYSQGQTPQSVLLDALQKVAFDFEHPTWLDTDQYRLARVPQLIKATSTACIEIQSSNP